MNKENKGKQELITLLQQQSKTPITDEEAEVIIDRLLHLYRILMRKPPDDVDQFPQTLP